MMRMESWATEFWGWALMAPGYAIALSRATALSADQAGAVRQLR